MDNELGLIYQLFFRINFLFKFTIIKINMYIKANELNLIKKLMKKYLRWLYKRVLANTIKKKL
jgi:hypothetical protein